MMVPTETAAGCCAGAWTPRVFPSRATSSSSTVPTLRSFPSWRRGVGGSSRPRTCFRAACGGWRRAASVSVRTSFSTWGKPVRGWLVQQLVKLVACRDVAADIIVHADSDVALVRPFDTDIRPSTPKGASACIARPA